MSVNVLLSPVLPESSEKIRKMFNFEKKGLGWKDLGEEFFINKVEQLFPRVDVKDFFADDIKEEEKMEESIEGLISFDEFKKVEMVVSKVMEAKKVEKADKLLELVVDTGTDKRTLVAGIALYYKPEDLIDKKILIVKNLQPATIRGILSKGMILAACGPDGRHYLPIVPEETPVGALLI